MRSRAISGENLVTYGGKNLYSVLESDMVYCGALLYMARYSLQINLTSESQKAIDALHKQTKMPKRQIVARLLEWFSKEDELTQLAVLGIFSERTAEEVSRMVLGKMAGLPPPQQLDRVAS